MKEINKERLAMYGTILEPGGAMFAPFYYPESEASAHNLVLDSVIICSVQPLLHSSDRTICFCACRKPPLFFCATGNFLPSLSSLQLDALIWRQLGTPQKEREKEAPLH